ncbi:MAG: lipooligosaccharide transport system permease protein [Frankiaceae bacterium]|jgi:lipooligosaccharide transport system permease protein|nr:lipooligosaccharide transport system permease protein [Frankiaceae bacterium]
MTAVTFATGGRRAAFEYWLAVYRRTWRGSVVTSIVSPVLFLAAMGVGLGSLVHGGSGQVAGVRYAVFLAPGLLAASVMQTAMGEATWPVMGAIKWDRTYLGMLATPLTVSDVLLGHLAFMTLRVSIVATAFTVVTALFGLVHSAGGAVLALPAAVLTGTAFAAPIAAFSATQARETGFILLYRFGLIPLFLFSGTFFPVSQLPLVLRPVAWLTPLWHGVSLCRDLALSRGSVLAMLGHAAYLLALTALGVLAAQWAYRRRLHW